MKKEFKEKALKDIEDNKNDFLYLRELCRSNGISTGVNPDREFLVRLLTEYIENLP